MSRISLLLPALALLAAAAPASAQTGTSGWSVTPQKLSRSLDRLSVEWRAVREDDDTYGVRVEGCGDTPPYVGEDVIHFDDEPMSERVDAAHEAVEQMVADAVSECGLPEETTARAIAGFDAAYTQFMSIRK